MGWINAFRGSGETERVDPSEETVINGAPYDAEQGSRSGGENRAAPVDRADGQITGDIKRQQISLAVRYVTALRAR